MVLGGFLAGGLSPPPARNGSGILSDTSVELKAFLGRMLEVPVHPSLAASVREVPPPGPPPFLVWRQLRPPRLPRQRRHLECGGTAPGGGKGAEPNRLSRLQAAMTSWG